MSRRGGEKEKVVAHRDVQKTWRKRLMRALPKAGVCSKADSGRRPMMRKQCRGACRRAATAASRSFFSASGLMVNLYMKRCEVERTGTCSFSKVGKRGIESWIACQQGHRCARKADPAGGFAK